MKKYIVLMLFVATCSLATSCKNIESEPPRAENSGLVKNYKLPDPKPLTAQQRQAVKDAKAEYDAAVPQK